MYFDDITRCFSDIFSPAKIGRHEGVCSLCIMARKSASFSAKMRQIRAKMVRIRSEKSGFAAACSAPRTTLFAHCIGTRLPMRRAAVARSDAKCRKKTRREVCGVIIFAIFAIVWAALQQRNSPKRRFFNENISKQ